MWTTPPAKQKSPLFLVEAPAPALQVMRVVVVVVVLVVVVRDTKFKACCVACAGYARQSRNRRA